MMREISDMPPSCRKVYDVLRRNAGSWVTGYELNRVAFAYSQRVGELKREFGLGIDSKKITKPDGSKDSVHRYRLNIGGGGTVNSSSHSAEDSNPPSPTISDAITEKGSENAKEAGAREVQEKDAEEKDYPGEEPTRKGSDTDGPGAVFSDPRQKCLFNI